MRPSIVALLLILAAPLCGQPMLSKQTEAAIEAALKDYLAMEPEEGNRSHFAIVSTDSTEPDFPEGHFEELRFTVDGEQYDFFVTTTGMTLAAALPFQYAETDCAAIIVMKEQRWDASNWPLTKWAAVIKKESAFGSPPANAFGITTTIDTTDRAIIFRVPESLLAVHTEDAWKVYTKPPELFAPDWDMQYFFERRWEQQRDKLMERYRKRKR